MCKGRTVIEFFLSIFVDRNKELLSKELSDLKLQYKMLEESREAVQREYKKAQRQCHDVTEMFESSQKDVSEYKRWLKDSETEKEITLNSVNELHEVVKATEGMNLMLACVMNSTYRYSKISYNYYNFAFI